jgi:hypothetical protein
MSTTPSPRGVRLARRQRQIGHMADRRLRLVAAPARRHATYLSESLHVRY